LEIWASEPVSEAIPDLKRLQHYALSILEEIDRVCNELGVDYFVCGGTMLGYTRHQGFIPWDDDIDIGMPREDYERFKKEAPDVIDTQRFFVQTRESDPNIPYLFSKVRLNNSSYITEYNQYRDYHKGFCVDVFPFDAIPNGRNQQIAFKKQVRKAKKRHNYIVNRQYPQPEKLMTKVVKPLDWLIAQINGRMLRYYYWRKPLTETQQTYDRIVQSYNEKAVSEGLEYIASFIPTYTMVKRADVYPLQRVAFEGITVNMIANPAAFLSMQYGDFLAPPPLHKRCGHDLLYFEDPEGNKGGRLRTLWS
jgi:lipopolysaccharide cholinephosphotransferase